MSTLVGIKAYKLHIPHIRFPKWNPRPPMWGQQGAHARMNVALTRPPAPPVRDAWPHLAHAACAFRIALLVWRTAGETAARLLGAGLSWAANRWPAGQRVESEPITPGLERYVTIRSNTVSMETQCHSGNPECATARSL